MTRRELAGSVMAAAAMAQTPAAAPSGPAEELEAARAQNQRNAEALGVVNVPVESEPAFHFKA
jgi:hypothetical protein